MKVSELIKQLQTYHPDTRVADYDDGDFDLDVELGDDFVSIGKDEHFYYECDPDEEGAILVVYIVK